MAQVSCKRQMTTLTKDQIAQIEMLCNSQIEQCLDPDAPMTQTLVAVKDFECQVSGQLAHA